MVAWLMLLHRGEGRLDLKATAVAEALHAQFVGLHHAHREDAWASFELTIPTAGRKGEREPDGRRGAKELKAAGCAAFPNWLMTVGCRRRVPIACSLQ